MKHLVALLALLILTGCAGTAKVQDGKLDPVEAATIRVAVGAAMSAYPKAIPASYAVSTALLVGLSGDYVSLAPAVDLIIEREVAQLNLDAPTKASFNDLVALIRARLMQQLQIEGVDAAGQKVMVRELVLIVQESAKARM